MALHIFLDLIQGSSGGVKVSKGKNPPTVWSVGDGVE